MKRKFLLAISFATSLVAFAEDGYRLWLRYDLVKDAARLTSYRQLIKGWSIDGKSPTLDAAGKELSRGLEGLLGQTVPVSASQQFDGVVCTKAGSQLLKELGSRISVPNGTESFTVQSISAGKRKMIVIAGNSDVGILYGVFHLLRAMQTSQDI